jgi:hypothetical protein
MYARVALLTFTVLAACAAGPLLAQAPEIPPGYTAYQVVAPGVGVPPLPFKIEGDRFLAPEGSLVQIGESHVTETRATFVILPPGDSPARFVGIRKGDVFEGIIIIEEERVAIPAVFAPVDVEVAGPPDLAAFASAPGISRVEIVPAGATVKAGEPRRFVARVFDESGAEVVRDDVEWYAGGGRMSLEGEFRGTNPGTRTVIAIVGGAIATTTVEVTRPDVTSLSVFTDVPRRLAVGSRVPLEFDALTAVHRWELDPEVAITASDPAVVGVDGHTLVARATGRATVTLRAGQASETFAIDVVPARAELRITGVPPSAIRTGDVVRLAASVADARPIWAVAEPGASVWPDGAFVAERPGTYTVVATLGDRTATARVTVQPRPVTARVQIQGHGANLGAFSSDLWPQNSFVYVGTHQANQLRTYDVSDPATPVLTDSQAFDARVVNDVKVSEDGRWLVATREGAANRRNGILLFSLADPAHPQLVSEYTETLTAGVHNAFWVGSLIYVVNDGTGDMHIIDASVPASPREVGRWGLPVDGRSLHDMWVQDGVAYLSYMRDGLVILDAGGAGKGGTPTQPVLVSRIFYPGGPTHSAFRAGDYVFVGDEDFSLSTTVPNLPGIGGAVDPRGPIHVIDVSNLERPRYVAVYEVPEAGAHNFWVQDDVLYVGYYQGGIRVVDVSGELRGDLYRQGREITHFLPAAGPDAAKVPYSPMVWGVFPMFSNGWTPSGSTFFATDYNSGLWTFTVEREPEERPIS